MQHGPSIATFASLMADPARASMLTALMSGMALTAGELAREAGVTPPTATAHLNRLTSSGLLAVAAQGRHRYYRLAGPEVAEALESLMSLAASIGPQRTWLGPRDPAMREARVCYDHLAGKAGVELYDRMITAGLLVPGPEGVALSAPGRARFIAEGIDTTALEAGSRPLCRTCLDWSERRPHLAGSLAAALLRLAFARHWARREAGGRTITFAPGGMAALIELTTGATGKGVLPSGGLASRTS